MPGLITKCTQIIESLDLQTASRLVAGIYGALFILHLVLPAQKVQGYCCDSSGKPLTYRLNGIVVYAASVYLFYQDVTILPHISRTALYKHHLSAAVCACGLGLLLSVWFYLRGCANAKEQVYNARNRCITVDMTATRNAAAAAGGAAAAGAAAAGADTRPTRTRSRGSSKTSKKGRSPPASKAKPTSTSVSPTATRGRSRSSSRLRAPPPPAPPSSSSASSAVSKRASTPSEVAVFFLGCEWNPRVLGTSRSRSR